MGADRPVRREIAGKAIAYIMHVIPRMVLISPRADESNSFLLLSYFCSARRIHPPVISSVTMTVAIESQVLYNGYRPYSAGVSKRVKMGVPNTPIPRPSTAAVIYHTDARAGKRKAGALLMFSKMISNCLLCFLLFFAHKYTL